MPSTFFMAPAQNFLQTTLNGAITDAVQTITLNSTTGFKKPGYIVINRTDSAGTSTPSAREVIYYTDISGSDLTGCVRGADGSTARAHSDGAVVETCPTSGMWNSLVTIVSTAIDGSGYLKAIASPVSIARAQLNQMYASVASIGLAHIEIDRVITNLNVSGASVEGFVNLKPTFVVAGPISGASTGIAVLPLPDAGNWKFFSIMINEQVSTASLNVDVNLNGTSIFDTGFLMVPAGGTYVSTASIKTKAFSSGQKLSIDVDAFGAADGYSKGFTLIGRST